MVRDLCEDDYAKKAPNDRKTLCRTLLSQAAKSHDDPSALWVLCREAQDLAVQLCETGLFMSAVDVAASNFDIDAMAMRAAALAAAGKSAKGPEDFAALAASYPALIDDLVAADFYDSADKAATSALQYAKKSGNPVLQSRATVSSKEVSECKALYVSFKNVLELLAKSPENELGG